MKIRSAEFVTAVYDRTGRPGDGLAEIALVGKSNVGKSSLINTLVGKKGFAKTSSIPGKTRSVNFYRINGAFYLVDLPGYGYAKASAGELRRCKRMVEDYFAETKCLMGIMVVLDPRRDPGRAERELYEWIEGLGVPVMTVFTKCDKLSGNKCSARVAKVKKALGLDRTLEFSATTGSGKALVAGRIEELLTRGAAGTDG